MVARWQNPLDIVIRVGELTVRLKFRTTNDRYRLTGEQLALPDLLIAALHFGVGQGDIELMTRQTSEQHTLCLRLQIDRDVRIVQQRSDQTVGEVAGQGIQHSDVKHLRFGLDAALQ